MILSRLILNMRNRDACRDLASPYEMHRTLMRVFAPEDNVSSACRFLWRLEPMSQWKNPTLLVQSSISGFWNRLPGEGRYLVEPVIERIVNVSPISDHVYRFRLQANPVISLSHSRKKKALLNEEEQLQWLSRQGLRCGFTIEQAIVISSDKMQMRKSKLNSPITMLTVLFEGYLRVKNSETLKSAIENGIGREKSFGCGLLSLGGL